MVLLERHHAHRFQLDRRCLEAGLLAQLAPGCREWCLAAPDPTARQVERGPVGGAHQEQGRRPSQTRTAAPSASGRRRNHQTRSNGTPGDRRGGRGSSCAARVRLGLATTRRASYLDPVTPFAELLDRLFYTPPRNGKLRLLVDYFRRAPDPERGYALAAITGTLSFDAGQAGVGARAGGRADRSAAVRLVLRLCRRSRGDGGPDLAGEPGANRPPDLAEVVEALRRAARPRGPQLVAGWLDALDATGRWALLKLVTGALRIGVSARLAKLALADYGGVDADEVEEVWHGLTPPYVPLFAWLEHRPAPRGRGVPLFRPLMLAHPLEERMSPAGGRSRRLPRRMEVGRHPRTGRGSLGRSAALFAHWRRYRPRFPDLLEQWRSMR